MDVPFTHYALAGDVHVAYQVVGDAPIDLVYAPPFVSNVELWWDEPVSARFLERLASFSRLVIFDKRGTGLSDRIVRPATLEERMDDIRAVMDAAGSERAVIFGASEGGTMCSLFAATYPERTRALILWETFARFLRADDYPFGATEEEFAEQVAQTERSWREGEAGQGGLLPGEDELNRIKRWFVRMVRMGASPAEAVALAEAMHDVDIRHVLPTIRVPTLALSRGGNLEQTRHMAENIPGARFVELPGGQHLPFLGDQEAVLAEIETFVTGEHSPAPDDRVLATLLFTDIVDSTERAAELGDRAWGDLLDAHDKRARDEVERFRGSLKRSSETMGDGILATFDGPARAIRCAAALRDTMRELGVEVRAGLHSGEIEVRGDDIGGLAVHIASRVAAAAAGGEILVSSTVRDLVAGSGLAFDDRGEHELKGVPEPRRLYATLL